MKNGLPNYCSAKWQWIFSLRTIEFLPRGDRSATGFGGFDAWVTTFDAEGNRNHYATDPEGDTLAWSISGGADSSYFEINATTGKLLLQNRISRIHRMPTRIIPTR